MLKQHLMSSKIYSKFLYHLSETLSHFPIHCHYYPNPYGSGAEGVEAFGEKRGKEKFFPSSQ